MPKFDDESGITLVEIVLSLLILGVVLTALFGVLTGGLRSLSESRARQTSSQLATEIIEELRRLSPSEIAMYYDGTLDEPEEFDPTTVPSTCAAGYFDPDGDGTGPLGCEKIATADQGAIRDAPPFQTTFEGVTVTTIATEVAIDAAIPEDTIRVTVVLDYSTAVNDEQIRRSALFSEVSRG